VLTISNHSVTVQGRWGTPPPCLPCAARAKPLVTLQISHRAARRRLVAACRACAAATHKASKAQACLMSQSTATGSRQATFLTVQSEPLVRGLINVCPPAWTATRPSNACAHAPGCRGRRKVRGAAAQAQTTRAPAMLWRHHDGPTVLSLGLGHRLLPPNPQPRPSICGTTAHMLQWHVQMVLHVPATGRLMAV
jgi:hypothetical protein